jgi:hypothetical protein
VSSRGLCIDPRWSGGTPSTKIASLYRVVRYVLFSDSWSDTAAYINSGWYVQGVIARESGDPTLFADWGPPNFDIVIGNEPEGGPPSSWVMSPAEYGDLWASTRNYDAPRWIAGMCSGDVSRAERYLARAPGAAGLTVHLYGLSPAQATRKIRDYAKLGLPVRVGEWHPAEGYRLTDYAFSVHANDFCLSDAMVEGMGLYL